MKTRIDILNDIFNHFQNITQNIPQSINFAFQDVCKAECLIEMLETSDCGSIGGYDSESPLIRITGFMLYDRFLALVKKHNNQNDIKKVCYFSLDDLTNYYKKISEFREQFNKN